MNNEKAEWSRRRFLRGVGLGAGAGLWSAGTAGRAMANEPEATPPFHNPIAYHFRVGTIDAWSISDGQINLGNPMTLMHPETERPHMKAALQAVSEPTNTFPLYINLLVLRIGREVAIVDAGFGDVSNARLGWFRRGLAQIGIAPEEVTAGFLSHAHGDHIDGFVTRAGQPAFHNAAIQALRAEEDVCLGANPDFSQTRRNPKNLPGMVANARGKFEALQANRQPLNPGAQLFGGALTVMAAPGHTAGHAIYRIRSGHESLLHISDSAHHQVLMFANPDWTISFDDIPDQAAAVRRREFTQAAAARDRVFGFHLPWPGLGRITAHQERFAWIPEPIHWL